MNRLILGHNWAQISVETGSKNIRQFAASLRRMGWQVKVIPMGNQVTDLGTMKLTMVDIRATGLGNHGDVIDGICRRYGF